MNPNPSHRYDDMLPLRHPQSAAHPPMARADRAAQFAPFSALAGYEASLAEEGRLTQPMRFLDESAAARLDARLQFLRAQESPPEATFTYFQPDSHKAGGAYLSVTGTIKRMDTVARRLYLEGGESLPLDALYSVESPSLPEDFDECDSGSS